MSSWPAKWASLGGEVAENRLHGGLGRVHADGQPEHDFGRLGVSNAVLDKRGQLAGGDWERIRLQPYLTERMLKQSEALSPLGAIGDRTDRYSGCVQPE